MTKQFLTALVRQQRHSLEALEDSAVLLTVATKA